MNFGEFQEKKSRGTFDFPIELHHVTKEHPRYQMPFHWHMDYELIRVLKGSLVLSLNEETLNLTENSGIVLVCDGVLHGGMTVDCVSECLDFALNEYLRGCSAGKKDIDDEQSHRIILDNFFAVDSEEYKTANRLFDTFIEEKKGYEFIIQGLLFELMGQILGNHRYKISDDETYKSLKRIRQFKSSLKIIREKYVAQIFLPFLFRNDRQNAYRIPQLLQNRMCGRAALVHRRPRYGYCSQLRIQRPELFCQNI